MTKHARFLHIEHRREDDAPESEAADRARIEAVIGAAPPSIAPSRSDLELDPHAALGDGSARDRPDRAELSASAGDGAAMDVIDLPIEVVGVHGQPFVRCARCGADSTIHANACRNCAAPLDTAEQRAFNEKVWDARLREHERERAALAEMTAIREEQRRQAVRPLPDPDMAPPPELLELPDADGPFLLEAIRALEEPRSRWIAGALVVGLPLLLVTLGGAILGKVGWGLALLLVLSMFPRSVGRRLLGWWTGR